MMTQNNPDPRGIFAPGALALLTEHHILHACRPIEQGPVVDGLLAPLAKAIPRYEVRPDIAIRGSFEEGDWAASSGHLCGRFMTPLFGIPATGRATYLRFGCFQRWEGGQVAESIVLLDLPSLMLQAGVWPLAAPLGPDLMAPSPATRDGIWPTGSGTAALRIVEDMIGGLMKFDGSLKTMNMRDYFAEDFWWFGPGPIGCFRGFDDYERGHALPFLTAFPDRVGGHHRYRRNRDADYDACHGFLACVEGQAR
jgi:hypothetical protein